MIVPVFYKWGVFIARVKFDETEQRYRGTVGKGLKRFTFTTKYKENIRATALWGKEQNK